MTDLPVPSNEAEAADHLPHPPPRRWLWVVRMLTVVSIVASLGLAVYFRDRMQQLKPYGYAAVFLVGLVSNATLILPIPGLAVSSVMGGVFNPWIVGLVGGLGQAVGEMTGYMAGYSGQTWVDENPTYQRMALWMRRYGITTVFILALVPNPIFDIGGMIAGALRMPVWQFLVSCAAGKVLKNIVFAMIGYYGLELFL